MHFQTPQFIEVEDKIFGPLTLKQFLYLIGGGAVIFLLYAFLPFFLFIIFAIPAAAFSGALAFYKMNGQPFIKTVEKSIRYLMNPKIYIWRRMEKKKKKAVEQKEDNEPKKLLVEKLTQGKLDDLSWKLDTKNKTTR